MLSAVILAAWSTVLVLAQSTGGQDWTGWIGGPITAGLVATLFLTGQLTTGKAYREERAERIASQQREREALQLVAPLAATANGLFDRVLEALPPPAPTRSRAR